MTEAEAKQWLAARWPDRFDTLSRFVGLLRGEAEHQSLIARSTFDTIWVRHILDSAQLLTWAQPRGTWLDVGSGAGLPGIVVAILRDEPVILAEPRRKRIEFLQAAVDRLGLRNVTLHAGRVETMAGVVPVISARAVAPIGQILAATQHLVSRETTYLLPRGRNAQIELETAQRAWHGAFHVKQSITDQDSAVILASGVTSR